MLAASRDTGVPRFKLDDDERSVPPNTFPRWLALDCGDDAREPQPRTADRAVAYPHDWNRERYPDRYGFGDEWRAGEVLVIPVDEVPVDAELVEPPSAPRRPAREVVDAEAVQDEQPRPIPAPTKAIEAPPRDEFAGEAQMRAAMQAASVIPGLDGLAEAMRQLGSKRRRRA